jgi:hypothetical protein
MAKRSVCGAVTTAAKRAVAPAPVPHTAAPRPGVPMPPPADAGWDWSFLTDPSNPYLQAQQAPVYADDGGGGGGYADGGGGGGAPAVPAYDPATDPAFQALLAQLNLKETMLRQQSQQKLDELGKQSRIAVPRIQEQGIEQRRGINYGHESRGLYRSGARLRDLSLQQRGETQKIGDVYDRLTSGAASIDRGLQSGILDLANQRAQANFEAKLRAGTSG